MTTFPMVIQKTAASCRKTQLMAYLNRGCFARIGSAGTIRFPGSKFQIHSIGPQKTVMGSKASRTTTDAMKLKAVMTLGCWARNCHCRSTSVMNLARLKSESLPKSDSMQSGSCGTTDRCHPKSRFRNACWRNRSTSPMNRWMDLVSPMNPMNSDVNCCGQNCSANSWKNYLTKGWNATGCLRQNCVGCGSGYSSMN